MKTGIDPLLAFISEHALQRGNPPTVGMMSVRFGANAGSIVQMLRRWESEGLCSIRSVRGRKWTSLDVAVHALGIVR